MRLVADIGGTHTRLALAQPGGEPSELVAVEVFASSDASSFEPLLDRYLRRHGTGLTEAVIGVPGPVSGGLVRTTNLPWVVDRRRLVQRLGCPVALLNDVEAAAWGLDAAHSEGKCEVLQPGTAEVGTRVLLSLGTGLGQAVIARTPEGWWPMASEGSHADFAPSDDRDLALWRQAGSQWEHVSWERFVSGPGLLRLAAFIAAEEGTSVLPAEGDSAAVAKMVEDAREGRCVISRRAVAWLSRLLGAQAGNLALAACALGGVYLAGGLLVRLGSALDDRALAEAFCAKGRYRRLLEAIPIYLVRDDRLGLRGASCVPPRRIDHSTLFSSRG